MEIKISAQSLAVALFATTALPSAALATTIGFDALGSSGTGFNMTGPTFSESGYTLTGYDAGSNLSTDPGFFYTPQNDNIYRPYGQATLGVNYSGTTVVLTNDASSLFSISSIDVGENTSFSGSLTATFIGVFADTSTISQSIDLDGVFGLETLSFAGFDDLTGFGWTMASPYFMVDNLEVSTGSIPAVPLPAGLPLLAGALCLLGLRARRKA
ncbi:hypothetical protein BCF46_2585 [Litoreibacter meonggei]|uniref:Secreted protein n=1 Tax=Litoreibacter meonggei TaxID=1049199 RepID=A0A497VXM5_9RHOB|nr:hypothetical protein [Litoreibacter meonggei]RLJ41623.1 hypothetical protein BCF46_2585 [Litoreibacter meonggei]